MVKTLTIKAHSRPETLKKTLQSIVLDKGCKGWTFCVAIDWSNDQELVEKVVHEVLSNKVSYYVLKGRVNLGYARNHIKALKFVFEEKEADWNLDFDDDYHVYLGWSNLCSYYTDILMAERLDIFSGHLQSQFSKRRCGGFKNVDSLVRVEPTFGNHGTLLRGADWRSGYGKWITDRIIEGNTDYESLTFEWMRKHDMKGARPLVSRIEYQPNNGVNFTEELCRNVNSFMLYTNKRIPKSKFRVVDVGTADGVGRTAVK